MVRTIGKRNKMTAILSTIGKPNTIGKHNRPQQFEFRTCSVFKPPLYFAVFLIDFDQHSGAQHLNIGKNTQHSSTFWGWLPHPSVKWNHFQIYPKRISSHLNLVCLFTLFVFQNLPSFSSLSRVGVDENIFHLKHGNNCSYLLSATEQEKFEIF